MAENMARQIDEEIVENIMRRGRRGGIRIRL
jgi:hypothetical protein